MAVKKLCGKFGCNNLIDVNEMYCNKHNNLQKEKIKERNRLYDRYSRNQQATAFYNSAEWKALRLKVKNNHNGLCCECLKQKILKPGYIADHIIPIGIDWSLRLVESNIQFLCVECHNTKTAEDKRKYGNK